MTKQISIRFDVDNHEWLTEQVKQIRPETTINKYINWLVEKERNNQSATNGGRFVYYTEENE